MYFQKLTTAIIVKSDVGRRSTITKSRRIRSLSILFCFLCFQSEAFAERTHHYFFGYSGYKLNVYDTPEELGQDICLNHYTNLTYGRVRPNPDFEVPGGFQNWKWGGLVCVQPNGQEYGVGIILTIACPDAAGSVSYAPYFQCPPQPPEPDKDDGTDCGVGNPCNPATGGKFQVEEDFKSGNFKYIRYYNSRVLADKKHGIGWRSNLQKNLSLSKDTLVHVSSSGTGESWSKVAGVWQGDPDSDLLVSEDALDLFRVDNKNGSFENYNRNGQITSEVDSRGFTTSYIYDVNSHLLEVIDDYGYSVKLSYENQKISAIEDSLGVVYGYEYDANNNLAAVVLPDLTPNDSTDNPRRTYHYELTTTFPNHLTGIADENGDRYATYAYDSNGKAISTEHAQTTNSIGQEHFGLDY